MNRRQSDKMKRRAALATFVSLLVFAVSFAGMMISQHPFNRGERMDAAQQAASSYVLRLGAARSAADQQQILRSLVAPGGPVHGAIVVNTEREIVAANPDQKRLVGKSLATPSRPAPVTPEPENAESEPPATGVSATEGSETEATASEGTASREETEKPAEAPSAPDDLTLSLAPPEARREVARARAAAERARLAAAAAETRARRAEERAQARVRDAARRQEARLERAIREQEESHQSLEERFREVLRDLPDDEWNGNTLHRMPLTNERGQEAGWLLIEPRSITHHNDLSEALTPLFGMGMGFSWMIYAFMLPWWVYLDARARTTKAVPLALFVFFTNFIGWLTYLVIRPESERLCPGCDSSLDPGFRLCPVCGWSDSLRCHQCHRPARPDWRYCPYCEAVRPDLQLQ